MGNIARCTHHVGSRNVQVLLSEQKDTYRCLHVRESRDCRSHPDSTCMAVAGQARPRGVRSPGRRRHECPTSSTG